MGRTSQLGGSADERGLRAHVRRSTDGRTAHLTESHETAEAICARAKQFGADIICVGSHTRPGFTAKVLGSVSLAVLQCSRRPLLVVWPPAE